MATQQTNGGLPGIGQVVGRPAPSPAGAATDAARGDAARNAQIANGPQAAEPAAAPEPAPDEGVNLSPDAQNQLDADAQQRQQEQEAQQQAEVDARSAAIEHLKQEIEAAKASGNEDLAHQLTGQLHEQEDALAAMYDPPSDGKGFTAGGLAETGKQPDLIMPRPAGGYPVFAGGSPGFPGFTGAPVGFEPGGPLHTPTANPNTQIPDFGPSANKAQIGQMLDAASQKYGVPDNLLKAVAWQESSWNSKALSFDGQHGKGVMQIDDRFHAFARTPEVFDPAKNIDYGAKMLAGLHQQYGSWQAALKHYNGGDDYPPKVLALAQQQPWAKYA